jgi:hypothetical protein
MEQDPHVTKRYAPGSGMPVTVAAIGIMGHAADVRASARDVAEVDSA